MATPVLTAPIICGVDFSDHSRRALAYAQALASRLGAPLEVVTALDPLLNEAANREYGEGRFQSDARRDLDAFTRAVATRPDVRSDAIVGDPPDVLLDAAHRSRASLIVVGTQGLGRAKRMLFGSTTWKLLRVSDVPVLAVPPAPGAAAETPMSSVSLFDQILCGVDFGDASVAAARLAVALGQALEIPVTLVHAAGRVAVPQVWSMFAESASDEQVRAADARLRELAAALGENAPAFRVVPGGALDVFQQEIAGTRPLIVLGLGGADGHRPGSTAVRVLAETPAPVLAVPV
jgi:nucleotide-binding universal stress UspA family protein